MEYCSVGDLRNHLLKNITTITWDEGKNIFNEVVQLQFQWLMSMEWFTVTFTVAMF